MATENGVTVTNFRNASVYGKNVEFYSDFDTNSLTFIYNEAGESSITSGEIDLSAIHDNGIIQISVPTFGSGSIQIRIEGRVENMTTWGVIYSKIYTGASSIDKVVKISESIASIRVGILVVTPGVDIINIRGTFKSKTR